MNDLAKQLLTWAIIAIVLVSIFNHYAKVGSVPDPLSYSEFLSNVRSGQVLEVNIQSNASGNTINGRGVDGGDFQTFGPLKNCCTLFLHKSLNFFKGDGLPRLRLDKGT